MNMMQAIETGFRRYFDFSGRASRSEYWWWTLFSTIVIVVMGVTDELLNPGQQVGIFSFVNMIVCLVLFIPGLAVSVRRLHDIDRTGWWLLLAFTIVGNVVLIYWACVKGTEQNNRFGTDPLGLPAAA